jgi:ABC-2 type transport system permease protein
MNMLRLLIGFIFTYATGFTVLYVLFRADSFLFHFRDYELIAPLPVRPIELVAVKMILMMTGLYLMVFLLTSPILIVYFIHSGFHIWKLLIYLVGVLFVPLLPTIFFSLAALALHRVSKSFKNNKLASILLLMAFTIALVVLSTAMSLSGNGFLIGQTNVIEWINAHYPVSEWFIQAVDQADWLKLGGVILLSGIPFTLFVFALPKPVLKLNQSAANAKQQVYVKPVYESRSAFRSLVRKESMKFFSVPMYAMNSGIGIVMLLLAAVASLIFKQDLLQFLELPEMISGIGELVVIGFVAFCIAMVYTPAVSLSLEGKSFWIVKSLPLEPKKVMRAKIVFNLLLQVPAGLIGATMMSIAFGVDWIATVSILLFVAVFSFMVSSAFALINLFLPKFDWINEIEVVKQSLAAMVAIFGSFGVIALAIFLILQLSGVIPIAIAIFVCTILFLLLGLLFERLIARFAENLFMKMKA